MTSRDFCYWLQGFFELTKHANGELPFLNPSQASLIERHLALVFQHEIDPSFGSPEERAKLQATHDGITALEARIAELEAQPPRIIERDRGSERIMC
jgi:hypothetical protein